MLTFDLPIIIVDEGTRRPSIAVNAIPTTERREGAFVRPAWPRQAAAAASDDVGGSGRIGVERRLGSVEPLVKHSEGDRHLADRHRLHVREHCKDRGHASADAEHSLATAVAIWRTGVATVMV